jgi:single-stranded-DNA-specific exonuclease
VAGQKNFDEFKARFFDLAETGLRGIELTPVVDIDVEIKLSDLTWELLDLLVKFEPYGQGNSKPVFCAKNLNIEQVQTVGADGKHLKVLVSQDNDLNNLHKLIGFSFGEWCAKLKSGDKIDIVFELGVNEWNGNKEMQLKIEDLRLSEK